MKRLYYFFRYFGNLMYYRGCEKLTLWDKIYKRRIGIDTAWGLSKLLHP